VKVLHCVPGLGGGGAERQLAYLAAPLGHLGWEVHVAAASGGPNLSRLVAGGARFHAVQAGNNYDPRLAWRLAQVVRRVRPDVIQAWFVQMDVLGGVIAEVFRIPWILSERSSESAYPATIKNRVRILMASAADAIVANSTGGVDYWKDRVGAAVPRFMIPNALPFEEIDAARAAITPALAVQPGDALVLFAGRFGPEKNIQRLVGALKTVVQRPNTKAVLCGDGELRPQVVREIGEEGFGDRIFAPGYVENLWPLLKRADVVVAVGLFEGRPNTVIEAMACARPLVLSDIPAHREILPDDAALWVASGDPGAIAGAILASLDDPAAAKARGAAGYARARRWSIDDAAREYDRVYREVVARRNS